jgi:hypothetical protein
MRDDARYNAALQEQRKLAEAHQTLTAGQMAAFDLEGQTEAEAGAVARGRTSLVWRGVCCAVLAAALALAPFELNPVLRWTAVIVLGFLTVITLADIRRATALLVSLNSRQRSVR